MRTLTQTEWSELPDKKRSVCVAGALIADARGAEKFCWNKNNAACKKISLLGNEKHEIAFALFVFYFPRKARSQS